MNLRQTRQLQSNTHTARWPEIRATTDTCLRRLPVYTAVLFQHRRDERGPPLCAVILLGHLKRHRPEMKVDVVEAEL